MNISGVVVRTFPKDIGVVSEALSRLDGVEVHGANDDGRLVVTVEQSGEQGLTDVLNHMQDIPRILSTSLIYHQFEELAQQEDEA
jgi:nitrate reductase NapD